MRQLDDPEAYLNLPDNLAPRRIDQVCLCIAGSACMMCKCEGSSQHLCCSDRWAGQAVAAVEAIRLDMGCDYACPLIYTARMQAASLPGRQQQEEETEKEEGLSDLDEATRQLILESIMADADGEHTYSLCNSWLGLGEADGYLAPGQGQGMAGYEVENLSFKKKHAWLASDSCEDVQSCSAVAVRGKGSFWGCQRL